MLQYNDLFPIFTKNKPSVEKKGPFKSIFRADTRIKTNKMNLQRP